jgi:CDP-2,3-bis-(O-geranylgeranyl)-sn-glycerol synthase
MLEIIFSVLWLLLPSAFANMTPPLMAKLFPHLNYPMDMGFMIFGKRLFGSHKTWRGFITGVAIAGLVFVLQQQSLLEPSSLKSTVIFDYANLPWYLGFLMGIAALLGDAIKSTFKRQMSIESGKSWFPWDQIDWVIGSVLIIAVFVPINFFEILLMILVGLIGHLIFKLIGFVLKIDKNAI